jgi:hypothetical protein
MDADGADLTGVVEPMNFQVAPPSVVLYTPRPVDTLLRTPSEPVPR